MATLNDVPFKIIKQVFTTVQNNSIKDILGSDAVSVEHMGYSTEPLRLVCFVQNEDEYDNFKEEYHSSGTQTLIIHENSGRQYTVYGLGSTTEIDGEIENYKQGIVFLATFKQATPYKESIEEITRTKTITPQNQEWSADDDGNDVKTLGNVDAVPDIQVISTFDPMSVLAEYAAPSTYPSGLAWDGTNIWSCDISANRIYKHNSDMSVNTEYTPPGTFPEGLAWDGTNIWSCDTSTGKIYKHNSDMSVNTEYAAPGVSPCGLTWDGTNIWSCDWDTDKIYKHNSDMSVNTTYDSPGTKPTGLAWDGTNIWSCDYDTDKIYKHNSDISIHTTYDSPSTSPTGLAWDGTNIWSCDWNTDKIYKHYATYGKIKDIEIYNTADTSVKCAVSNDILTAAVHRINVDGTGTIDYNDDFSTNKWSSDSTNLGITRDATNNELDIADDGYIYWPEDTKYPITGTPTLTARINTTAGIPTIQISTDASTWYDIDTAIVDDVETVYPLDSDGNISLAGKTVFYWRIDCVKAAAATCSIKFFELDIAIHTIYAKNPKITKGASASTFRCDQDPDSGLACEVELIFRHRWWT